MIDVVWLIPALPLAGFLVILLFGRRLGEPKAGFLATAAAAGAFVVTVGVFLTLLGRDAHDRTVEKTLFTWMAAGGFDVKVGFLVDPLSIAMALFVTGIGSLIHLYAIGYMHGDPKFSKFFLYLNLFVFSMLMLILGSNMLMTFLGWEGVGTCSYFLISFWHTKDANASAGKKAFVTNRIGDFGFMIAMFLTFQHFGTLDYLKINEVAVGNISKGLATAIALMLLVGACGKSAQLPLFVWLPDAMAGPTPVSALIHAATMVTAGVYLMTRTSVLLSLAPNAAWVVAVVGVATALFAATIAIAQNDIKKVLAYSTISQLGYMFLAVGSGAYVAAIFHMITHAFFKALLFLGSGSVIHGMHDEQDMRRMGQLRKWMPVTWITFMIGWLAIAGVPPFAGFWSKDEILLYAFSKSPALYAVGLLTALLTAFYMTRQVIMVFYGDEHWNAQTDPALGPDGADLGGGHGGDHGATPAVHGFVGSAEAHVHAPPHESGPLMLIPLVVLALLSIVGGALQLPFGKSTHFLEKWLEPVIEGREATLKSGAESAKWGLLAVAVIVAAAGITAAYFVYQRKKVKAVEPTLFAKGWFYDSSIAAFMGGPGRAGFQATADADGQVIDGAVNGVGKLLTLGSGQLRKTQTGFVRSYAAGLGVGVVLLLGWFVVRGMF